TIIAGYGFAMGLENAGRWEYLAALVVFVPLIALVASTRDLSRARRAAVIGFVVVLCYAVFRQGFVRHDDLHAVQFFAVVMVLPFAFLGRWRLDLTIASFVVAVLAFGAVANLTATEVVDAYARLGDAADVVRFVSAGTRDTFRRESRASLRAQYGIPDQ